MTLVRSLVPSAVLAPTFTARAQEVQRFSAPAPSVAPAGPDRFGTLTVT